ncbi:flagellar motor stator protein MotA [Acidithiobacillus sp. CV18-2]|uniref:Flagellar motor stator protein MotA n=1 Tax=Igneacidithiobacillus copahuensis TaxID=2724909 RepID=A0AAE2YN47_9PROT|nr:flagellar motor stator protein MotA [Igneacidithiobacillus copahuensis]MBU2754245.1 flagellar motor stator protein MotA [Acidithiobacillus sp. CV18-3]MBU2755932.1 flagellar motor stator protein MotA [Acidithiobacillus sp. BN09-2]MBU2778132.1 flagellar motor stator protein MotA [Acidithiobacillus sp. CV18-2]MBU2796516.1 flagellar motor stator protein MotA [Acidithiobacillus sp. VAN18-2]MBU2800142.1 flagellar motor stator protein MotA [Acidithiobacillus sp. VAN18-4]UTV80002.1 flagellar motor
MFLIIGYVIALGAIFGGFMAEGGKLAALIQPFEALMIIGGAFGAFFASTFPRSFKAVLKTLPMALKGSKYTRAAYMELLSLLNEIFGRIRQGGLMSIEADVDDPQNSELFKKYPTILADHHVLEFLTDYLRLMVGGTLGAFEMENLMDVEIDTHHRELEVPIHALTRAADGMPAFGIVAAVMGVVNVMSSVDKPPAVLGELIAAALVGTFLGILLGYAVVSPIAARMEDRAAESSKMLETIKVSLLATMNAYPPQVAVEFGRKVLYSTERPSFQELDAHLREMKGK